MDQQPALLPQYFAAFSACLGGLSMGTTLGYSSPAGPLLTNGTDYKIHLTGEENGYFGAVLNIGALLGGLLAGYTISAFGRKPTMVFSIMPFLLGWGLIAGAQDNSMLLVGRVITGLCCGITSVTVPTYIGEFSSPKIRGTLGSGFQLFVTIGILYAYSLAPFMDDFRWIAVTCAAPSIVYCCFVIFCKESPSYLLTKKREAEAKQSLQYFRGKRYDISKEMESLKIAIEEDLRSKKGIKDLKTPYILKPFLISVALMFFQQFSGINAVLFNLSLIFESAGTSVSDEVAPIIIGILLVLSTLVTGVIIDKSGRKLLLIISGSAMAISLVALGVYFYELDVNPDVAKDISWLPLASLSVYIVAFSIGYGPIPWIIMGEVFSSDIREVAASLATTFNWTCAFIVTLIYQPLSDAIHDYGVYWMYAGICVINVAFCFLVMIETKGKSIQEITAIFGGPSVADIEKKLSRSATSPHSD